MAKIRITNRFTILLVAVLLVAGCDSLARKHLTSLEPIKIESGYQYFRYKARTDFSYPSHLATGKDEEKRMDWLKDWLTENGYQDFEYKILSRQTLISPTEELLLPHLYDIYYDVKIKAKEPDNQTKKNIKKLK